MRPLQPRGIKLEVGPGPIEELEARGLWQKEDVQSFEKVVSDFIIFAFKFSEGEGRVQTQQARPSVISGIVQSANPAFIAVVVCVPIIALTYAMNFGTKTILDYVHVLTGGLWTGIDLFMGFVLGPVLGGLQPH